MTYRGERWTRVLAVARSPQQSDFPSTLQLLPGLVGVGWALVQESSLEQGLVQEGLSLGVGLPLAQLPGFVQAVPSYGSSAPAQDFPPFRKPETYMLIVYKSMLNRNFLRGT